MNRGMYYELCRDLDNRKYIFANRDNLASIATENFKIGYFRNIIEKNPGYKIDIWPEVNFYFDPKKNKTKSDYLLNAGQWPIVHKRIKNIFEEKMIENIQYLPVNVIDSNTGAVDDNYYVMNIMNCIEAYDMKKSIYHRNEKYPEFILFNASKIILNKENCLPYDIFRCIHNKNWIYVSEKIKTIAKQNKFTGMKFFERQTN
jgi:hypothetical protein